MTTMTNNINLSESKIVLFRRISAGVAALGNIVCFLLLVFGFVPLYGESVNVIDATTNLFCLFEILDVSFWPCFCKVLYSVFYIISFVFILKAVILSLTNIKKWLRPRHDLENARYGASVVINAFNSSLMRMVILVVVSTWASPYTLSGGRLAALIALIAINLIANSTQIFYLARNIVESILQPVAAAVMLGALLVFAFDISTFNFYTTMNALGNFFILSENAELFNFALTVLCNQVLLPVFYLITSLTFLTLVDKAYDVRFMEDKIVAKSRGFAIKNFVFITIIISCQIFLFEYKEIGEILELFLVNINYILVSAVVWVAGCASRIDADEIFAESPAVEPVHTAPAYTAPVYTAPAAPASPAAYDPLAPYAPVYATPAPAAPAAPAEPAPEAAPAAYDPLASYAPVYAQPPQGYAPAPAYAQPPQGYAPAYAPAPEVVSNPEANQ